MNRVVKKHSGSLPSTDGNAVRYDLYAPHVDSGSLPIIVFLHGFKGFKDWGTFPDAFFEIALQGFAVLAINFSHNGIGLNSDEFDHLDLFESQTLSQEIEDIRIVLEALKSGQIGQSAGLFDLSPIGIIGHSRGGHAAIVAAAEFEDISCIVTWSSVLDCVDSWSDDMKKDWDTKGKTEIKNTRTGQMMPIGKQLYDDALQNRDKLSAQTRVKELYIPSLFIHGTADETVPHRNSQKLYEACPSIEKEQILIEGANHTFGSAHPFDHDELPPHFHEVIDHSIRWFQTYLF